MKFDAFKYYIFVVADISVGDRMFLGMQDFDCCQNLIKIYPIYLNMPKF